MPNETNNDPMYDSLQGESALNEFLKTDYILLLAKAQARHFKSLIEEGLTVSQALYLASMLFKGGNSGQSS